MRITGNILTGNMLKHLQRNIKNLDGINQKLSTGKQFQRPSENPIKVANSMQYNSLIKNSEQYQRNVEQARNWLNSTENSLADAGKVLQRARELAVYGVNGSLSPEDRDSTAKEVKELRDELITIANNKLGDRYLFSGQATSTKPFDNNSDYLGDHNKMEREINPSIKMTININGEDAFTDAIDTIDSLYNNLEADNADDIDQAIGDLDTAIDNNSSYRAEVGAKVNRLDLVNSRLDDEIINLKRLLSENEDVDIAETITDMKMQESVYRSALSVGARIIQPSLVDFIE